MQILIKSREELEKEYGIEPGDDVEFLSTLGRDTVEFLEGMLEDLGTVLEVTQVDRDGDYYANDWAWHPDWIAEVIEE